MRWMPLVLMLLAATGCGSAAAPHTAITLATTTSVQDSGLLDDLLPVFEKEAGVEVKVVAVGSGQAIEIGRRGDADVLLTHSPAAEQKFMDDGFGEERRPVMHNDFVIAGPTEDPASIAGQTAAEALAAIASARATFVSRGDESGTHQKERALWKAAGIEPRGDWYIESGSGMAQALRMATEKRAYVLADRGTLLALSAEVDLKPLCEGDPLLINRYAVMTVSTTKHPHVNAEAARALADYLTSPAGRERIAAFGRDKFGRSLFVPDEL